MVASPFDIVVRLSRAQAEVARRLDRTLSAHGLALNDLLILLHLAAAPGHRLRRIDLAEAVGMTASGVTRALGPLERIGLLERESNPRDARVAYAHLTATGKQVAVDARATAERTCEVLLSDAGASDAERDTVAGLLARLGGSAVPS